MKTKHRILTLVLNYIYATFLFGTGIMTLVAWQSHVDMSVGVSEKTAEFMSGIQKAGYIVPLMGFFKTIAGIFLAIPRTSPFGAVLAFPYAANIILYIIFIAYEDYAPIGIFDFLISSYLIYAYFDFYKPMFSRVSIKNL